ncbi:tetratricopeptide repeat protein [Actinomadura sp. NPDC048394]|uniref:tetratricopeptide repeat protein n=1 Tax=Actinomadura sp. NPDC048394 TaxID=3158223 RepID=UPI0033C0C003
MELLAVLASVAGVLGLVVGVGQWRVAVLTRRDVRRGEQSEGPERPGSGALPVAVPTGRLPADVVGRDDLLAELSDRLGGRASKKPGGVWVLAGMGGVGKSTVALRIAVEARGRGRPVWWVNASDAESLRGGILEILHHIDAPEAVAREVREGTATASDRVWEVLSGRRGLLVLDNADDPGVLTAGHPSLPADGTGWIRPDGGLMILVTTRHTDPSTWGTWVRMRTVGTLDDASAAALLRQAAPQVDDPGGEEALALARRLGGLPLALHLAGAYLAAPFARWRSFAEYQQALDGALAPDAVIDLDRARSDPRGTVLQTWELSLDALARQGVEQGRELLCLLSCFAPDVPLPESMLLASATRQRLEGLRALATVALIDITTDQHIRIHPVVADTGRTRLLTTFSARLPDIGTDAVKLLQAAVEHLDTERPADWPAWQRVLPHIRAMLHWLAPHLEDEALIALLGISRQALAALWLDGNKESAGGEELARASLSAATSLGDEHPEALAARHLLAVTLFSRDRAAEAEQILRTVLDDQSRVLGPTHPDTLATRDHLADTVMAQNRFGEAEQMYRGLTADQHSVLGAEHPDTLATAIDFAWSLGMQGNHQEAARLCRRILDIDRRVLGAEHPRTLDAWSDLARWTGELGRHPEAEQMSREALEVHRRVLGAEHPLTLRTGATLARAIAAQGRHSEATAMLGDLLDVMKRVLGDAHSLTIGTREELSELTSRS